MNGFRCEQRAAEYYELAGTVVCPLSECCWSGSRKRWRYWWGLSETDLKLVRKVLDNDHERQ